MDIGTEETHSRATVRTFLKILRERRSRRYGLGRKMTARPLAHESLPFWGSVDRSGRSPLGFRRLRYHRPCARRPGVRERSRGHDHVRSGRSHDTQRR
jgi:hypothetical protein